MRDVDSTHPMIVLDYGPVPKERLLSDLATLSRGLAPNGVLRVTSERPESLQAVADWLTTNGFAVLVQDSAMVLSSNGCVETFTVEARRAA